MEIVKKMGRGAYFCFYFISCVFCLSGCRKEEEAAKTDVDWLKDELVIINSVDPSVDDVALDTIFQKIGDARIVGLGEGSHGTTEFWSVRQKITRYLVEKKGFNTVLMEASFPGSIALHNYVATGEGTESEAHKKLGSWRYKEMQNLIRWMRQYNIEHPGTEESPSLHFYGYDCAFSNWNEPINFITEYLQITDAGEVENVRTRLLEHTRGAAVYVHDLFISRRSLYISQHSEAEYERILRIVINLLPSWEIWDRLSKNKPTLQYRDSVNIQNVNWILDNLTNGGKVILWAHNAHIRNGYFRDIDYNPSRMLGSRLHEIYGDSYYTIATEFYGGTFMAWDECAGHDFSFVEQQVGESPADSYTYLFRKTGVPYYFLDMTQIDYSDNHASWFRDQKQIRSIGATYCFENDKDYYESLSLPENYSGIIYIERSHPTSRISF